MQKTFRSFNMGHETITGSLEIYIYIYIYLYIYIYIYRPDANEFSIFQNYHSALCLLLTTSTIDIAEVIASTSQRHCCIDLIKVRFAKSFVFICRPICFAAYLFSLSSYVCLLSL